MRLFIFNVVAISRLCCRFDLEINLAFVFPAEKAEKECRFGSQKPTKIYVNSYASPSTTLDEVLLCYFTIEAKF